MPTTTTLGLAVSSNQNDLVLDYWNKMLNESDGNFVILDNQFAILKEEIAFSISTGDWTESTHGNFTVQATITLADTLVQDGSTIEALFEDIANSAGVVLASATQSGANLVLVFYADEAKTTTITGVLKYVY